MTDDQIFDILEGMPGAPRLTVGRRRYVFLETIVIETRRLGKGDRWEFSPSTGATPVGILREYWPREVREWVTLATVVDFGQHARAMSARTL